MKKLAIQAIRMLAVLSLVTGIAYPVLITGIAKAAFKDQADGNRALLGQSFEDPKYFWGRLSAASYNAQASTGSNLGPTNEALTKAAQARIDALRAVDPENTAKIPVDLVTSSGSGLDPHISPAAAEYQLRRVARTRGMSEAEVRTLCEKRTEGRTLGLLGEPRLNVVLLNQDLDHAAR